LLQVHGVLLRSGTTLSDFPYCNHYGQLPSQSTLLRCNLYAAAADVRFRSKADYLHSTIYHCFAPESGHLSACGGRNDFEYTPLIHCRVEKELSPRNGTFGQTGTLGNLIDRLSPALFSLFHGLQRRIPSFGYLRGDMLLGVMLSHRKLYGLTRTRQRFRCLEIGNRLSRSLTALVVFAIAGKIGVAIDLVHLHVSFAHPLTRFVGGLVQPAAPCDRKASKSGDDNWSGARLLVAVAVGMDRDRLFFLASRAQGFSLSADPESAPHEFRPLHDRVVVVRIRS
jgi:hypothetical protein